MTARAARPIFGNLLYANSWELETHYGRFQAHEFRNVYTQAWAIAMTRGDWRGSQPVVSRVHSSCVTSETFGGCDCDCAQQLASAMRVIASESRGVLFYLMQEGRGAGLTAKVRDRMLVQASGHRVTTFEAYERLGYSPDSRRYGEVAAMCALLGIEAPLTLLTNNPDKVTALEQEKVRVHSTRSIGHEPSAFNRHYLKAKQVQGHSLFDSDSSSAIAEPPRAVRWMDPVAVPGTSVFQLGAYFLPIRVSGRQRPAWFRLSLYWDSVGGTERVVLELEPDAVDSDSVAVRFQPEVILERFPLREPLSRIDWQGTLSRFLERGAGIGVFLPADFKKFDGRAPDAVSVSLMRQHLGRRMGVLIPTEFGDCDMLADSSRRLRVDLLPLRGATC